MWPIYVVIALACAGCGRIGFAVTDGDSGVDAERDGAMSLCGERVIGQSTLPYRRIGAASSGDLYVAVWGNAGVLGATRLDLEGNALAPATTLTTTTLDDQLPGVSWSQSLVTWAIGWASAGDLWAVHLDPNGAVYGPVRITTTTSPTEDLGGAWSGNLYGVGWVEQPSPQAQVWFTILDAAGARVIADRQVASGNELHSGPSVMWTGSQYLVVWREAVMGSEELVFATLDTNGNTVSGPTVLYATSSALASVERAPAIWTGTHFGVLYINVYAIRFIGFQADGTMVFDQPLASSMPGGGSVVWNGSRWGVAWREAATVRFQEFLSDGTRVDPEIRFAALTDMRSAPQVVTAGGNFAVIWNDLDDVKFAKICR